MLKKIGNALLIAYDHFISLACETNGSLCADGETVRDAFMEFKNMKAIEVFGSLSKTAAGSLREMADRMDKAGTAFEFAKAAGDMADLNVRLLQVSADWANAERRDTAA